MGVAAGAAAGGESDVASASLRPSNENSFFGSSSVHERTLLLPSVAVATQDGCASGALLAGLVAGNDVGKAALLFYLAAYALTNLGAFGVIALLGTRDSLRVMIAGWIGHCEPPVSFIS